MPDVHFHNSRTRRRDLFVPLDPSHIRLYVCGPTVYERAHIGNARTFLIYDVLVRMLRATYPRVTYVRNITDVDDKINARAAELNEPIEALTARTTALLHDDLHALGLLPPDIEPRATAHIPEMIALIERLIAGGFAYEAQSHVLFAVAQCQTYGALSGRDPDALLAGARVEIAPYKHDPGDFVLWKPSEPALPGWESPWGRGRPGWHIECSAMAARYLGNDFDLHGGGQDLLFPHHENERAQSLCGHPGSHFAQVWLHSGMLRVNGAKMSKSLGNIRTVPDVLAQAPAEAIRLLMLQTHYRAELDFTDSGLAEAKRTLDRFYRALDGTPPEGQSRCEPVTAALSDDLNTPLAIAEMHQMATNALAGDRNAAGELRAAGALLGLLQIPPAVWFHGEIDHLQITASIAERSGAKAARDFGKADAIRERLRESGIVLEDTPAGTTWRRA